MVQPRAATRLALAFAMRILIVLLLLVIVIRFHFAFLHVVGPFVSFPFPTVEVQYHLWSLLGSLLVFLALHCRLFSLLFFLRVFSFIFLSCKRVWHYLSRCGEPLVRMRSLVHIVLVLRHDGSQVYILSLLDLHFRSWHGCP